MKCSVTRQFFLVLLLSFALPALAAPFFVNDRVEPFAVIETTGDPVIQHQYFGTLDGYPDTYEITADESFALSLEIDLHDVPEAPTDLGVIIVKRPETGRVQEVARLSPSDSSLMSFTDETAIPYLAAGRYEEPLAPGVYRIEISSPDNRGQYRLTIGTEPADTGYFERLASLRSVHEHFGYGLTRMLRTPLVYQPLIIFALVGIVLSGLVVYRRKQRSTSASDVEPRE